MICAVSPHHVYICSACPNVCQLSGEEIPHNNGYIYNQHEPHKGQLTNFLMDTGSSINCIPTDLVSKLEANSQRLNSKDHTSCNDVPMKIIGTCQLIKLFNDEIPTHIKMFIASNISEAIISFQQMIAWKLVGLDFPF